jgi:hypothetical protein
VSGIQSNPAVPANLSAKAQTELTSGVPFISDDDLEAVLQDAGVTGTTATAIVDENSRARVDGLRASLGVLALFALVALVFSGSLPTTPVGADTTDPASPEGVSERTTRVAGAED